MGNTTLLYLSISDAFIPHNLSGGGPAGAGAGGGTGEQPETEKIKLQLCAENFHFLLTKLIRFLLP